MGHPSSGGRDEKVDPPASPKDDKSLGEMVRQRRMARRMAANWSRMYWSVMPAM
jgi:hypothetical protein